MHCKPMSKRWTRHALVAWVIPLLSSRASASAVIFAPPPRPLAPFDLNPTNNEDGRTQATQNSPSPRLGIRVWRPLGVLPPHSN